VDVIEERGFDDSERLGVLDKYAVLDTAPEPSFDRMAELAARVASAPVANINFVDRERAFSKARFGTAVVNIPRALAACADAMWRREALVLEDLREVPRYANHPLVLGPPHFRSYVGLPLRSREGLPLGAVGVLDRTARSFTAEQLRGLELVAREVEQHLEERRAQRERVAASGEPLLSLDDAWVVRHASPAALALLQLAHEPCGEPLSRLLTQEAVCVLRAVAEHPTVPAQFSWRERRFEACVHVVAGGYLVALRDISEQAQRADADQRARGLLEAVIAGSPDAIFAKDLRGRYTLANDSAARLMGRTRERILGHTDSEILPETAAQARVARDLSVIGAGRTTTYEVNEVIDGTLHTWLLSKGVLRSGDGLVLGVFGIAKEITERKRMQQAVEVGEERLRLAMNAGRLGAWDWDVGARHLCISGATQELVGVRPTEPLEGEQAEELVVPEDRPAVRVALRAAIREGIEVQCDFRVRRGEDLRWLHARGRSLTDGSGKVSRIVGVVSDVTDQKEHEARAEKLARFQEQLFGIVSHDLRSPLSAIRVWAGNLARDGANPNAQHASERIVQSTDRMERMISDLLDFTRARLGGGLPLECADADLHEICRQVVEELGTASPGRVGLSCSGEGRGTFDANRMAQVVSNLVGNALQHTPEGTPVEVGSRGLAESLELTVHNTGPAIPPDQLPVLFEPFRQGTAGKKKTANLGLGLYITREAVRAHGGSIEVASSEEAGTTFKVVIPRAPPSPR